jgi:hypothetical protein
MGLSPLPATAQGTPPIAGAAGPARPAIKAARLAEAPVIDGRLDDATWNSAARVSTFVQQAPIEGAPASQQTVVQIGYDSDRLYFAFHARYTDPALIRANRADRDQTENDDKITITFDPFLDQQLGYSFSVNGYGVQGDSVLKGNTGPGGGGGAAGAGGGGGGGGAAAVSGSLGDLAWNVLFASAGQLVEDGWTAEMAIPLKSLRYPARGAGESHRWGFQIEREIQANNEIVHWAPVSNDVVGYLRQMGVLEGITNLSTSRNFEVLPTFTAVQSGNLNTDTGAFDNTDVQDVGVSLKYGITSNLTFDFTLNPDFSQIESDRQQIEVNQRFPINYPELRPFFLEGMDNFRVGGPATIIHTRTIVDPQFGAKVTGKVGKTTLGFQVANDEAPGKRDNRSDPAFGKVAQIVLARARYDFRPQQWIGAVFTNREFLGTHSRVVGLDAPLQVLGDHLLRFLSVYSNRLDAQGVQRTGFMSEAYFRKEGRNIGYTIFHYRLSPDFGTDLGFVSRVDQKQYGSNFNYKWWPESWIVNWGPQLNYSRNYDYRGHLQNENRQLTMNVQFARNINISAQVNRNMERYRDIDFDKGRFSFSGTVNANRRILFTGSVNRGDEIRFIVNPFLGHTTVYSATATLRPVSRLQSEIKLDTTRFMDTRNDTEVFDVKILRLYTTYQFTTRLQLRNIIQRNTFNKTLDANVLMTYRVNSGTAIYVGYDDHYAHGSAINASVFPGEQFQRTNRAIFTKVQYLFRRE